MSGRNQIVALISGVLSLQAIGCATVHHRGAQALPISSNPSDAAVTVRCDGAPTFSGRTPVTVTIRRRAARCLVQLDKEGYLPQTLQLDRRISKWFWLNLTFPPAGALIGAASYQECDPSSFLCSNRAGDAELGAVLGWLGTGIGMGVDALSGSMFERSESRVQVTLRPLQP